MTRITDMVLQDARLNYPKHTSNVKPRSLVEELNKLLKKNKPSFLTTVNTNTNRISK